MIFKILKNNFFLIIFTISILILILVYFIEYGLGFKPCTLCSLQRIPYFIIIFISSASFFLKNKNLYLIKLILTCLILNSLISFYHIGIEQGFFEETLTCNVNFFKLKKSTEDILKNLSSTIIKTCREIDFKIFGLSLTSINFFASIFLLFIIFKYRKELN